MCRQAGRQADSRCHVPKLCGYTTAKSVTFTKVSRPCAWDTSAAQPKTWPGKRASMSATTLSTSFRLREEMTTELPSLRNSSAVALPIPLVLPVMSALDPTRFQSVGCDGGPDTLVLVRVTVVVTGPGAEQACWRCSAADVTAEARTGLAKVRSISIFLKVDEASNGQCQPRQWDEREAPCEFETCMARRGSCCLPWQRTRVRDRYRRISLSPGECAALPSICSLLDSGS